LAAVPHEYIEAEGTDNSDQSQVQNRDVVFAQSEWYCENEQRRECCHGPLRDRQRVKRHVGGVTGFEHSGFAVKHRQCLFGGLEEPRPMTATGGIAITPARCDGGRRYLLGGSSALRSSARRVRNP